MEKERWNFRGELSLDSRDKVKKIQAEQVLVGNSMTQDETVDFIIKNYSPLKINVQV